MRFYLISNNTDTTIGMRLCGIDGCVVHTKEETLEKLKYAVDDTEIAVVLMTSELVKLCHNEVYKMKQECRRPLVVEIPDRHGDGGISESLSEYIRDSVGIKF